MQNSEKFCCFSLVLLALLIAGGCGSRDGTTPPPASISGSGAEQAGSPAGSSAAEKPEPDKLHPVAVIHTTLGDITVRLDAEHAPISVDNFLTYADKGHYDNTLVHQVLTKPAVILGGGFDTFQKEKPAGPPIRNEAHNGLKNVRGTIGMSRSPDSIDSSTSQFYINSADNPQFDHRSSDLEGYGYCVFGEVTAGMDVVDRIASAATRDTEHLKDTPVEQVIVKWIHLGK
jgi:peptidyl-prolyl cis-trans isomerase B (cyclophilin B)